MIKGFQGMPLSITLELECRIGELRSVLTYIKETGAASWTLVNGSEERFCRKPFSVQLPSYVESFLVRIRSDHGGRFNVTYSVTQGNVYLNFINFGGTYFWFLSFSNVGTLV